jgi:hypothetical protein
LPKLFSEVDAGNNKDCSGASTAQELYGSAPVSENFLTAWGNVIIFIKYKS